MKRLLLLTVAAVSVALPAAAQSHAITLGWTDTANTNVQAYNLYRASGTCPANPPLSSPPAGFTLVLSVGAAVGTTTHTAIDSTVAPGNTYCYVVTAVVAAVESAPSNMATGVEPGVFPPTNLQQTGAK